MQTRQQAIKRLEKAKALLDKANEIIQQVVENAPYGQYKPLDYLLYQGYEVEEAIKESRIYPS